MCLAIKKEDRKTISNFMMALSLLGLGLALVGTFWQDIFLASTQWLLVANFAAIWGTYLKLEWRV